MKKFVLYLILFLLPLKGSAQSFSETLIWDANGDSTVQKFKSVTFDKEGNYMIKYKIGKRYYFIQDNDTIGPLKFRMGNSISLYSNPNNSKESYFTCYSNKLTGPILGRDIANHRYPESNNSMHMAIPVFEGDKIRIYFDGEIIREIDTLTHKGWNYLGTKLSQLGSKEKRQFNSDDWMSISNNAYYIYTVEEDSIYMLYLNDTLINSSKKNFTKLRINNRNEYLYTHIRKVEASDTNSENYKAFILTRDSIYGPFGNVRRSYISNNGAFYGYGDESRGGPTYMLMNGIIVNNIDDFSQITLKDENNGLFTFTQNEKKFINVNGVSYELPYEKIYYPTLDNEGNFAVYGLRDYYLYKYVNGEELAEPISKYGVRPIPLYISPVGASIHIFQTDDSTYVYQDEEQLFPAFSQETPFRCKKSKDILPIYYVEDESEFANKLFYLEIDSVGYMVFNGVFSEPMISAKKETFFGKPGIGEIIAGELNENGFYFIQKTGDESWLINVNNTVYQEITGTSYIFRNNCFFDESGLVFYGIKDLSIFQFTAQL